MKHTLAVLAFACAPAFAGGDKSPPVAPQPAPVVAPPLQYKDSFDGWQRHMAFHALFGFAARHQWPDDPWKAWFVAQIPGLVGELIAEQDKPANRFSPRDMLSNAVGAAIGVSVGGLTLHMRSGEVRVAYRAQF